MWRYYKLFGRFIIKKKLVHYYTLEGRRSYTDNLLRYDYKLYGLIARKLKFILLLLHYNGFSLWKHDAVHYNSNSANRVFINLYSCEWRDDNILRLKYYSLNKNNNNLVMKYHL